MTAWYFSRNGCVSEHPGTYAKAAEPLLHVQLSAVCGVNPSSSKMLIPLVSAHYRTQFVLHTVLTDTKNPRGFKCTWSSDI